MNKIAISCAFLPSDIISSSDEDFSVLIQFSPEKTTWLQLLNIICMEMHLEMSSLQFLCIAGIGELSSVDEIEDGDTIYVSKRNSIRNPASVSVLKYGVVIAEELDVNLRDLSVSEIKFRTKHNPFCYLKLKIQFLDPALLVGLRNVAR